MYARMLAPSPESFPFKVKFLRARMHDGESATMYAGPKMSHASQSVELVRTDANQGCGLESAAVQCEHNGIVSLCTE